MGVYDNIHVGEDFDQTRSFQTKDTDNFLETAPSYLNDYSLINGVLYYDKDKVSVSGSLKIYDGDERHTLWLRDGVVKDCITKGKPPKGLAQHKINWERIKDSIENLYESTPINEAIIVECLPYYPIWSLTMCQEEDKPNTRWVQFFSDRVTPIVDIVNKELIKK